jgi:hypothetical protein
MDDKWGNHLWSDASNSCLGISMGLFEDIWSYISLYLSIYLPIYPSWSIMFNQFLSTNTLQLSSSLSVIIIHLSCSLSINQYQYQYIIHLSCSIMFNHYQYVSTLIFFSTAHGLASTGRHIASSIPRDSHASARALLELQEPRGKRWEKHDDFLGKLGKWRVSWGSFLSLIKHWDVSLTTCQHSQEFTIIYHQLYLLLTVTYSTVIINQYQWGHPSGPLKLNGARLLRLGSPLNALKNKLDNYNYTGTQGPCKSKRFNSKLTDIIRFWRFEYLETADGQRSCSASRSWSIRCAPVFDGCWSWLQN